MTKLLAILFFCVILSVEAQEKPKTSTPIEQLQNAIKLLESELPEGGVAYPSNSSLIIKLDKKQREMMEIQNKLMAVHLITEAIKTLEAEKQRTRVIPTVPPNP